MAKRKAAILLPSAKRDVKIARDWYNEQKPGLGDQFLKHVDDCLTAIGRSPKAFQIVAKDARRAVVRKFPFVIFYRIEGKTIYVYAVFHTSQNPAKWMDRLND